YEIALGAALGEDLDIPLGSESPAHWSLTTSQLTDPELPAGVEPLSSFVDGPVELDRRLKQIGIVNKSAIASIIDTLVCGQRLVSIEGDIWRWDGMRAAANAPTPAAKRLEQKNRLSEIEVKRIEIDQTALSLRKDLNEKKSDVSSFASVDQLARETLRECQKQVAAARDLYAMAERNVSELLARQTALQEQHTRLEQERSEATERYSSAVKEEGALKDISCLQNDLGDIRLRVVDLRRNVAETQALVRTLDREAQIRDNRLTAVEREQKNWKRRNIAASDQMKVLASRIEESRAERNTLVIDPDIFNQKRRELFKQISLSEDLRKQSADKLARAEMGVADSDRQARSALEALSRSREARGRAEERSSAARDRCLDIEKRIREELELEPSATRNLAGLDNVKSVPDRAIVETKLEKLKREREKLGGVNLRADDEAREISEKLDVMGTDRDDLVEAIKRLRTGIYNLNKEARERLLVAFEIVNGHFRDLFSTLFGGGQAELKLTEAEDPLDAGLDIIARPPGKKPQTMTLLSGGEQALTALSLIFAVFLTNPSPICVLDEVDAPLDDANVERYCSLLERMREQTETRFITITHNPITMSRMDRLYGVTMAERGVSQLVSVDLETATDFIEQDS
ncbi:MAG: chromosome segregation protein SMC, partial [Cohaesibacteraceae bacterium]|nr:chromosome segregation protein SMC [Cohaesibacteraceae bacterium]